MSDLRARGTRVLYEDFGGIRGVDAAAGVPVAGWGEPYYGEGFTALAAGAEGASHVRGLPLALA